MLGFLGQPNLLSCEGIERMRIEQPEGRRGSLKWIQRLVEMRPAMLDEPLRKAGALPSDGHLTWLSPLRDDKWAEYRDGLFLARIGRAHLASALEEFWPRRGPQWDALARDESGRVFLIEAKAHGAEMSSSCQAGEKSRRTIIQSIEASKLSLGAMSGSDWLKGYYQYANRLAHLEFLHANQVDAWLVFLYFMGDDDMNGPHSEAEWMPYINAAHKHLGLSKNSRGVVSIFQDVRDL